MSFEQPKTMVIGPDGLPVADWDGIRPLRDGEYVRQPLALMDGTQAAIAAIDARQQARLDMMNRSATAWASPGMNVSPPRPNGPNPLQWKPPVLTDAEAGAHAAQRHVAHREMREWSSNAWRGASASAAPAQRPMSDAERQADRAAAHREMTERLANGWRGTTGRAA